MNRQGSQSAAEQFNRRAERYNTNLWNARVQELLDWLLDNAELKSTDDVLDIAAGAGAVTLAIAPQVKKITGVDVSTAMLGKARRNASDLGIMNAQFQESSAEELPFENESFDLVTVRLAPHHFRDITAFVNEVARVLRPGGRFLVADTTTPDDSPDAALWHNGVERVRDPSHIKNLSPSEWRRLVESAGIQTEICTSAGGGITIPFEEWVRDGGCSPDQIDELRRRFANAPESARRAFQIKQDADCNIHFTWQRVVLKAQKPG